jgi:hypothetical protein
MRGIKKIEDPKTGKLEKNSHKHQKKTEKKTKINAKRKEKPPSAKYIEVRFRKDKTKKNKYPTDPNSHQKMIVIFKKNITLDQSRHVKQGL